MSHPYDRAQFFVPHSCSDPTDVLVQGNPCGLALSHSCCCMVSDLSLPADMPDLECSWGCSSHWEVLALAGALWKVPFLGKEGRAGVLKEAWLPHPLAVPRALPLCQSSVPTTDQDACSSQARAAPQVQG